jgi:hypothetical protein
MVNCVAFEKQDITVAIAEMPTGLLLLRQL